MTETKSSYRTSMMLVATLFFIFGFITWLNGTLIPFLKSACQLNNFQSLLVAFAFYISYFVMALPSSFILNKTGFKKGMSLGLLIIAVGCFIFIPAAKARDYQFFLIGLFTQGLGLSILQTATNPYVTILGPVETAAKRISIMGIANKVAGILSPIIFGAVLLHNMDALNAELSAATDLAQKDHLLNEIASRIINPYMWLGIGIVVLAILVAFSPLPEVQDSDENQNTGSVPQRPLSKYTYLFLGAFAIFLYVGVEVIAGDTIANYGSFLNIPMDQSRYFTSITLTFMVTGYLLGIIAIPKFISQERALTWCGIIGVVLTLLLLFTTGYASVFCLAALGLCHSLMWPAIWPMSIKGLGGYIKIGSALLIMGIAGGAILPLVYGYFADTLNPQTAYFILIPCYMYIIYFSISGHKIGYVANKHE